MNSINYFKQFNMDKLFFLVLFIFAARSTYEFSSFGVNYMSNFLLVFSLAIYEAYKHRINIFNKKVVLFFGVFLIWYFALRYICRVPMHPTFLINLLFTIWVCIILTNSLKSKLFLYFEQLTTTLTVICLVLYAINVVAGPGALKPFCFFTPYSGVSDGSMLIYNLTDYNNRDDSVLFGLLRNYGFAWEPGRYASFLAIAIVLNLSRTKFKVKGNKALYILLFGLFTTFSTTGYVAIMVTLLCLAYSHFKGITKIVVTTVMLAASLYIMELPFIREKIEEYSNTESFITEDIDRIKGSERHQQTQEGGNVFTPQRFECIALDFLNFSEYPLTGYGMDNRQSFVHRKISDYIALTNGIISEFAHWGLIIGLLFNIYLIKSSRKISLLMNPRNNKWVLILLYYILSVSYNFIFEPAVISLFLFTLFANYNYEKDFNHYYQLQ